MHEIVLPLAFSPTHAHLDQATCVWCHWSAEPSAQENGSSKTSRLLLPATVSVTGTLDARAITAARRRIRHRWGGRAREGTEPIVRARKPINMGVMLDWHAGRSRQTVLHLDRPFDIAPHDGLLIDGPRAAALVHEAAGWWFEAGARSGDRVAIVKDNHYDILLLSAGAARIGAVPAAISSVAAPDVLAAMLTKLQPTVTMVSPGPLARAQAAGIDLASLGGAIVLIGGDDHSQRVHATVSLDQLRGATTAPIALRPADEPMAIFHTSGTTGAPKLVSHSARSLFEANRLDCAPLPVVASHRRDTLGSAISFSHARATGTFSAQLSHVPRKLVVISRYDLDHVAATLGRHQLTTFEACPNIFLRWQSLTATHPELFARIRLYINTFDLIHPATVRAYLTASRRVMPLWVQGWGQSETGPLTASVYTRSRVRASRRNNAVTSDVGWPVPGFSRVRVIDATSGRRVQRGRQGLLLAATRGICTDYPGESPRYQQKVIGKWWNTGDMGYRDRLGRIRLVDREVDMIPGASGIEIESTLLERIPKATEVTVLGVPGRLPVPVICLEAGQIDDADWARAVNGLPPLDEPIIIGWDAVPRTSTWKVRRQELRRALLGTESTHGTGRWT